MALLCAVLRAASQSRAGRREPTEGLGVPVPYRGTQILPVLLEIPVLGLNTGLRGAITLPRPRIAAAGGSCDGIESGQGMGNCLCLCGADSLEFSIRSLAGGTARQQGHSSDALGRSLHPSSLEMGPHRALRPGLPLTPAFPGVGLILPDVGPIPFSP